MDHSFLEQGGVGQLVQLPHQCMVGVDLPMRYFFVEISFIEAAF
jgi:hypothetical protein